MDGQLLAAGVIRFIPMVGTHGPATSTEIKEGVFSLAAAEGPVVGEHRIEIEAVGHNDFELDDEQAYAERAKTGISPLKRNPIPEIYNRQSQLKTPLGDQGDLNLEFALKSQPGS